MSQPTAVIQVEGVLRKPAGGAPIDSGRRLYHGLAGMYRIVLATEETDRAYLGGWLGMEGFSKHDHVVYGDHPLSATRERWPSLALILKGQYGYDVDMFVVPDPHDAAQLIGHGHNVLLFAQAAYALPEWRPDAQRGVTPWAELAHEVETQRMLRAQDSRTEDRELR